MTLQLPPDSSDAGPATADILRFADRHPQPLPQFPPLGALPSAAALLALSDGTGVLQSACGPVPDRGRGYAFDDNLRTLLLCARAETLPRGDRLRLASTCASFVQHAWDKERQAFRSGMDYSRRWRDAAGDEDSTGRAAWVLGELLANPFDGAWESWAESWFDRTAAAAAKAQFPRGVAFAVLGGCAVLRSGRLSAGARALVERGGDILHRLLAAERRPDWAWFEAVLGHDNPRLPQALLEAGVELGREDWRDEGLESLAWIAAQQRACSGHFRPVGTQSAAHPYTVLPYNQQPLEAWAAIDAAASAYAVTRGPAWVEHAAIAHRWFFGGNDRAAVLGDLASGRCRNGITPEGPSPDCGAEAILAFQLACHAAAGLARAANRTRLGDRLARTANSTGEAAASSA
jgi:hypothetical protein